MTVTEGTASAVAIKAENLIAGRVVVVLEPLIELVAAIRFDLSSMSRATTIYMVNREKYRPSFVTASTRRSGRVCLDNTLS